MGQPVLVQVTGAVTVAPVTQSSGAPSLSDTLQIYVNASYGSGNSARLSVNSDISTPYVIPLQGITKVRFLAMKSDGRSMKLLVSSPNGGVDQVIPFSSDLVLHGPGAGDEFTSLKIAGIGDVSFVMAGDPG